jgi:predicted ribosomally synthesized peptide with SipW-like signal peptide
MNRKILVGILAIGLVALAVGWGTYSQFSDTETSVTTFSAGSLDLTINDQNGVPVTFIWNNLRPKNQPHYSLTLKNIGTIPGYLDISNIVVVSGENGLTEPEIEAGDTSADEGELDDVLNLRLFLDKDGNGWWSSGDVMIYNGLVNGLQSSYDLKEPINAGGDVEFVAEIYDWWTHGGLDNQAQTDTLEITFTFKLVQA